MKAKQETKTTTDHKTGQLKAILYLLQTSLDGWVEEVDRSYELLKIGEKTDFSRQIETTMEDPISSFFKLAADINEQAKEIVDTIVRAFLKHRAPLIHSAYKTQPNALRYTVVLQEDNIENRDKIFDVLDFLDKYDISDQCPVSFQFAPAHLIEKMRLSELLTLDSE